MKHLWWFAYNAILVIFIGLGLLLLPVGFIFKRGQARWFWRRLRPLPFPRVEQPVWFHAVSLGECQVALALINQLPAWRRQGVLLTTTTSSGASFLAKHLPAERRRLLPWDLPFCYRRLWRAYTRQQPPLVVVETEIWPWLFRFQRQHGLKPVIINGRLSAKTHRRRTNPLLRQTLAGVQGVLARGARDAQRFQDFGLTAAQVRVTGNIKFDFKPTLLQPGLLTSWLEQAQPLVIFASISADEAPLLAPAAAELLQSRPELHLLWAPRHLDEAALNQHRQALAQLQPINRRTLTKDERPRLLLLDSYGELAGCYAHAAISVIGGSFNRRGGQNFLESLQAGAPALLGPSDENFSEEAEDARQAGCLLKAAGAQEVAALIAAELNQPLQLRERSQQAQQFIQQQGGAIARTIQGLLDLGALPQHRGEPK